MAGLFIPFVIAAGGITPVFGQDLSAPDEVSSKAVKQVTRFVSSQGSKVKIEGSTPIYDWKAGSSKIEGWLEAGPDFPFTSGHEPFPVPLVAQAVVSIPVASLDTGKDVLNEVMAHALRAKEYRNLIFNLRELLLMRPVSAKDQPFQLKAIGSLVIAGTSKEVSMPVDALSVGNGQWKFTGETVVKMSDFKIDIQRPIFGHLPSTNKAEKIESVKINFDWVVAPTNVPSKTGPTFQQLKR